MDIDPTHEWVSKSKSMRFMPLIATIATLTSGEADGQTSLTVEDRLRQAQVYNRQEMAREAAEQKELNTHLTELIQGLDSDMRTELGLDGDISTMSHEEGIRALNVLAGKLKESKVISNEEYAEIVNLHWSDFMDLKIIIGVLILIGIIGGIGFGVGSAATLAVKIALSPKELAFWFTKKFIQHAPIGDARRTKSVETILQILYKNILYKGDKVDLSKCRPGDLCIGRFGREQRLFEYGWVTWVSRFYIWRDTIPPDKLPKNVIFLQNLPNGTDWALASAELGVEAIPPVGAGMGHGIVHAADNGWSKWLGRRRPKNGWNNPPPLPPSPPAV